MGHSWRDTVSPLSNNVLATHILLDALRRAGSSCRVVIPGSATVYAPSTSPLTEQSLVAPANPYALSKLAQEQLGMISGREDGIEVIVTRSFNHTGPRQSAAFAAPNMARQIALIEAGAAEPMIKVGNLDAQRDMTDVRDMAQAYVGLMQKGTPSTIYNVASGVARHESFSRRSWRPGRCASKPTRHSLVPTRRFSATPGCAPPRDGSPRFRSVHPRRPAELAGGAR